MARKKAAITLLDQGNIVKTIKIDLYLENDLDWAIFQQIRNQNVCFDQGTVAGTVFQHLWNSIKDIPCEEVLPRTKAPLGSILPTVMCGQQVLVDPNEVSFEHYASATTVGMIGMCPVVRFLEEFGRSYGCYIEESDEMLRFPVYFNNKEVDELKVKTLGQGRYTHLIAALVNRAMKRPYDFDRYHDYDN